MTAPDVTTDPWSLPNLTDRISLATSILGHAQPADDRTRVAVRRAMLALQGATIDEIAELEPVVPLTGVIDTGSSISAMSGNGNLGHMLRTARTTAGLSANDIGRIIGVSSGQIYNFEHGRSDMPSARFRAAMEACGVTIEAVTADA